MKKLRFIALLSFALLVLCSKAFAANDEITVAFSYNSPPYQFFDDSNVPSGLHIDIMNWIADQQGFSIKYMPFNTTTECITALNEKKADIVLGCRHNAGHSYLTQETAEISTDTLCLVTSKEDVGQLERLSGIIYSRVAVEYESISYTSLFRLGIQSSIAKGSQRDVYDSLKSGNVDAAIVTKNSFLYMLEKDGAKDEYAVLYDYLAPYTYTMLVRMEDRDIYAQLNEALTILRTSGSYERLHNKWIVDDNTKLEAAKESLRIALAALGIVLVLGLGLFVEKSRVNRLLKKMVHEKTAALERESKLRTDIIEFLPSGIITLDEQSVVTSANKVSTILSRNGTPSDDLVGKNAYEIPVLKQIIEEDQLIESADTEHPHNTLNVDVGNEKRMFRYAMYHLNDESNKANKVIMFDDVTRENQQKEALFEAKKNQTLNRIVAGIAHEIKNPLMTIKTAASLLNTQADNPKVQEAFRTYVPSEVERINKLVEDLINYAKPACGEAEFVNVAETVQECTNLIGVAARRAAIEIDTNYEGTQIVFVRKVRFKQLITNIIINAVESIEEKSKRIDSEGTNKIWIHTYEKDGLAYIEIKDCGIGMSESQIEQCTEPFYTTKSAGTGLGLALTKQYIEEDNGELNICSKQGEYTAITIRYRRSNYEK